MHGKIYSTVKEKWAIAALGITLSGVLDPSPTYKTYRHIPPILFSNFTLLPSIHLPTISTHTFDTFKNIKLPSLKVKRSSRRRHRGRGARPYLFRVDENRLVQWVREDHSQLVGERGGGGGGESFVLEDEEDFMVNEFDEAVEEDYLEEGLAGARGAYGEHVPLSAGITGWGGKGGRKNYGTAGSKNVVYNKTINCATVLQRINTAIHVAVAATATRLAIQKSNFKVRPLTQAELDIGFRQTSKIRAADVTGLGKWTIARLLTGTRGGP
ncbi:hypothetical protein K435DRAFT_924624 [Dendrothele bispora CBS 962.96]|uniref:Uncharacterized protein n=1 Tax=Dendrothele bispora (strain CBS 962.96) TaxID=1314807 RepID=A0A4S8LAE3_DENBC|nr:hypothetical protein K435DRAFT_924624 [Dendrothele bispora CBS 962.96]